MNNMSNGILPLDEHCMTASLQKHPASKNVDKEVLMSGDKSSVHPVIYEQKLMMLEQKLDKKELVKQPSMLCKKYSMTISLK